MGWDCVVVDLVKGADVVHGNVRCVEGLQTCQKMRQWDARLSKWFMRARGYVSREHESSAVSSAARVEALKTYARIWLKPRASK